MSILENGHKIWKKELPNTRIGFILLYRTTLWLKTYCRPASSLSVEPIKFETVKLDPNSFWGKTSLRFITKFWE